MQTKGKILRKYGATLCGILLFVLALPALPAQADPRDYAPGGFQGPSSHSVTTVAAAHKTWDDTYVTLVGHIVQRLSNDDYLFRDATGEIVVDIDHHIFRGQTVTPQTRVRITGEVDKEFMERTTIDVDVLEVL